LALLLFKGELFRLFIHWVSINSSAFSSPSIL
jgi:hypothetical protein